jgi:hypothetical protein
MPVSEVQLPDGSVIELQHPENTTEEQILGFARSHWNQISSAESVPPIDKDDAPGFAVGRGLSRGIDVVQSGYLSALEGLGKVTGLEGLEEYGAEGVAEQQRQLAEAEPYATRRQDVEGVGSGLSYVGETIGEQVPTLATTLAGAGAGFLVGGPVGSVIGGIGANIPFFYGMNREAQKESVEQGIKTEVSEGAAALYAIPQSALDFIADRFLLGGVTSAGKLGQNSLRTGNVFTRGVKGAAAGTIAEVPTEIGQQMLERLQANQSLTSDEAITEYIDVGVAAGILGGGVKATSSIVSGDIRNQDRVVEDYDPAYVDPDAENQNQINEAEAESSIGSVIVEEKKAEQANLEESAEAVAPVQVETTESRLTQALEQGDRQAGIDESVNMPKLPAGLEANPQYDGYNVTWKNDVDKALFIVSDPTSRSPKHDEYIAFLKQHFRPNKTQQDFIAMGLDIRKTLA